MAIKVWAPGERLTSADLNAAFAQAAQGRMPGIWTAAGAALAFAAAQQQEVKPGAPITDAGGFWNAAASRFIVPPGLGGLYLFICAIQATAGGTNGDTVIINSIGMGNANAQQTFGRQSTRAAGGTVNLVGVINEGTAVYAQAWSQTAANLTNQAMQLIRLASLGTY